MLIRHLTVQRRCAVLLALCVWLCAASAEAATPDPLANGPYAVGKVEYNAGDLLINIPPSNGGPGQTFPQPLEGSITYPKTEGPWKVLVFMHGRHSTCIFDDDREGSPPITGDDPQVRCDDTADPGGDPNQTRIRNYAGYDYLSQNLASHGYVVMSVSTNTIHSFDNTFSYDAGGNARSQVLAASLDLLYRWNNGAGPGEVGTTLTGKMEMQQIGLMGHSRGGEGVTDFIQFNRRRPSPGRIYNLQAVLALAPIDAEKQVPYGTNFATLLPACDGDVSTLAGANAFERSKYTRPADPFAKIQWYVQGANHNYFNTVWTGDDGAQYLSTSNNDAACGEDQPNSVRLQPSDQRRVGIALMATFLRRYLGAETALDPLMTGAEPYPASGCPLRRGVACNQLVGTSYLAPAAQRLDVLRPDADAPLAVGATGGAVSATGFTKAAACNEDRDTTSGVQIAGCPENAIPGRGNTSATRSTNRSFGRQVTLDWDGPATLRMELSARGRDVRKFGTISLRAATNWADARNPKTNGFDPASASQDGLVALIDRQGREATVSMKSVSTALEPSIGTYQRHVVLNGIRIPLSRFAGVDLSDLAAVELRFGTLTPAGSIQVADVGFQEEAPAQSPSTPMTETPVRTTGRTRTDAIAVGAVTTVPSKSRCTDVTAPVSQLTGLAFTGRTLTVQGNASDVGCEATEGLAAQSGALRRTQVTVGRRAGTKCRFLDQRGHLTRARPCSAPLSAVARGRSTWRLRSRVKLPAGSYRVSWRAVDAAGNLGKAKSRTLEVR